MSELDKVIKLRRQYPHLQFVERGKIKDEYAFLRWQAHEAVTEDVLLPRISRLRAEVNETVVFRLLVAYSENLEGLADLLRGYYEKEAA